VRVLLILILSCLVETDLAVEITRDVGAYLANEIEVTVPVARKDTRMSSSESKTGDALLDSCRSARPWSREGSVPILSLEFDVA